MVGTAVCILTRFCIDFNGGQWPLGNNLANCNCSQFEAFLPCVPFEKSYFVGLKPAVVLRSQCLQWSSTFLQEFCTVLFCTVQYGKVQYSTVWYSTVQYGKVLYSTVPYSTVHYSILQYSTSKYSTVYGCLITVAGWPDLDLNFRSAPMNPIY